MPNPLSKQDLKALDAALQALSATEKEIVKAKQAGLDVTADEERAKTLRAQLLALKRTYSTTAE